MTSAGRLSPLPTHRGPSPLKRRSSRRGPGRAAELPPTGLPSSDLASLGVPSPPSASFQPRPRGADPRRPNRGPGGWLPEDRGPRPRWAFSLPALPAPQAPKNTKEKHVTGEPGLRQQNKAFVMATELAGCQSRYFVQTL